MFSILINESCQVNIGGILYDISIDSQLQCTTTQTTSDVTVPECAARCSMVDTCLGFNHHVTGTASHTCVLCLGILGSASMTTVSGITASAKPGNKC